MVREGGQLDLGAYTADVPWRPAFTKTANVRRVLEEWQAGATIVLQALHVNWHSLAVFCRLLEEAMGHAVQANSYYTPRGSQGFAVHHDTHDVLVLQVAGEKRWLVYDPLLELPLKHQRYSKALGEHGEPVDDFVLGAGDTLYLPRGWLHQAETSDTDSLHLTIGINAYTWLDAARSALAEAEQEPAFRHGVEEGADEADRLAERLGGELDPELVTKRRRRKFVQTRRPIIADGLSQLRALERLDVSSALERRETVIADLEETGDGWRLVFEGRELHFPAQAGPELGACYEADEPFSLSELPGDIDAEGRLVLARRLVREGFLRVRDA